MFFFYFPLHITTKLLTIIRRNAGTEGKVLQKTNVYGLCVLCVDCQVAIKKYKD